MAQAEGPHVEGEGSPQIISLKSDVSGNHVDNGEVGPSMRRKRRKKRDPRPESIIVYRSEVEKSPGEDQCGEEGVERSTEEGDKFLCTPTGEGRDMGETLEIMFWHAWFTCVRLEASNAGLGLLKGIILVSAFAICLL